MSYFPEGSLIYVADAGTHYQGRQFQAGDYLLSRQPPPAPFRLYETPQGAYRGMDSAEIVKRGACGEVGFLAYHLKCLTAGGHQGRAPDSPFLFGKRPNRGPKVGSAVGN